MVCHSLSTAFIETSCLPVAVKLDRLISQFTPWD